MKFIHLRAFYMIFEDVHANNNAAAANDRRTLVDV